MKRRVRCGDGPNRLSRYALGLAHVWGEAREKDNLFVGSNGRDLRWQHSGAGDIFARWYTGCRHWSGDKLQLDAWCAYRFQRDQPVAQLQLRRQSLSGRHSTSPGGFTPISSPCAAAAFEQPLAYDSPTTSSAAPRCRPMAHTRSRVESFWHCRACMPLQKPDIQP